MLYLIYNMLSLRIAMINLYYIDYCFCFHRQDVGCRGNSMQDSSSVDARVVCAGTPPSQWRWQTQAEAARSAHTCTQDRC